VLIFSACNKSISSAFLNFLFFFLPVDPLCVLSLCYCCLVKLNGPLSSSPNVIVCTLSTMSVLGYRPRQVGSICVECIIGHAPPHPLFSTWCSNHLFDIFHGHYFGQTRKQNQSWAIILPNNQADPLTVALHGENSSTLPCWPHI